jgi:hypothetical protein
LQQHYTEISMISMEAKRRWAAVAWALDLDALCAGLYPQLVDDHKNTANAR